MQINKIKTDISEILSDVFDGATIMVGGFGEAGSPIELLHGLIAVSYTHLRAHET